MAWGFGLAVSLVIVAYAWWQAAGDMLPREQMEPFNVGIIGVAVAALACGLYLRRGRSLVSRRRVSLTLAIREQAAARQGTFADSAILALDATSSVLVAAGGMTRYHRADCQLAADKPVDRSFRGEFERAGLAPCGVCAP